MRFLLTSWEKFPRKPVSFVAGGFCRGLIGLLGTESTKRELALNGLNGGWEVVGLRRWEPVQPENHSQFHMWLSVGISR